jgi:hypothetical protein
MRSENKFLRWILVWILSGVSGVVMGNEKEDIARLWREVYNCSPSEYQVNELKHIVAEEQKKAIREYFLEDFKGNILDMKDRVEKLLLRAWLMGRRGF